MGARGHPAAAKLPRDYTEVPSSRFEYALPLNHQAIHNVLDLQTGTFRLLIMQSLDELIIR